MPEDHLPLDGIIEAVRQRDRYRCQNCRRHQSEVNQLQIYQIVKGDRGHPDRLTNLITLCDECHEETDGSQSSNQLIRGDT